MARPNAYDSHIKPYLHVISKLRSGDNPMSHDDIAKALKVAPSTYYKYLKEIDEFTECVKKGDEEIVEKLEKSLYSLAYGAKKIRTREIYTIQGDIEVLTSKEVVTEQLPPDNTSVFFALVNLSKGKWKHKQEVEIVNEDEHDDIDIPLMEALKGGNK